MTFRQLSSEDGISNNFVRSIFKDHWGYVWFGSLEGIDRYDGWEVKSYSYLFPDEVGRVRSITEDSSRVLWVGTDFGLFSWDRVSSQLEKVQHPILSEAMIYKVSTVGDRLFVCSDNGFFSISTTTHVVTKLAFHKSVSDQLSTAIDFIIEDDDLFIVLANAFIQYDFVNRSSIVYPMSQLLKGGSTFQSVFTCIAKFENTLYFGTNSKGVFCYDIDTKSFYPLKGYDDYIVLSIQIFDNKIFVGTDSKGLVVSELNHLSERQSSMDSEAIYAILHDENNSLWLGTYTSGVFSTSLYAKAFQPMTFADNDALKKANIRSLYFTGEEKFIGTRNGLFIVDKEEHVRHLSSENSSLDAKVILTIFPYGSSLLLGTYGDGVFEYQPQEKVLKPWHPELFSSHCVYAFKKDSKDNLWVTTLEGLMVIKYGKTSFYDVNNSALRSNLIYSLDIDSKDRIWVGTMRGVNVFNYDDGHLELLSDLPELSQCKITQFYQVSDHEVWVLTENQGIYVIDEDLSLLRNFTTEDGLCHNSVSSMVKTADGRFLISSLKGVSLYVPQDSSFVNYHLADGLTSLTFNSGAVLKDEDDAIWMGSVNGLMKYVPKAKKAHVGSNIIISDIYVGGLAYTDEQRALLGQPLEEVSALTVKGNNNLGFRFINTNAQRALDKQFMVKLESSGKSEDWILIGTQNTIYYSDLTFGNYVFSVKSSNSNSSLVKSLAIRVARYWYQSIGFVISLLVFSISFVVFLFRRKKTPPVIDAKTKYATSHLDMDKSKSILEEINRYILEEQIFLRPDLKIRDIAVATKFSIRDVSQAINQNLGESFNDYINRYRVEELKRRLESPDYHQKYTLLGIAKTCGFNSKSSLYRAFKKETGQTPAEYWSSK